MISTDPKTMMAYYKSPAAPPKEQTLYLILKNEFPGVPDEVIRNYMKECSYSYDGSKELLDTFKNFSINHSVGAWSNNLEESFNENFEVVNPQSDSTSPKMLYKNPLSHLPDEAAKLNFTEDFDCEGKITPSSVGAQETNCDNFINIQACTSSSVTSSHNVTHTQTVSQQTPTNNSSFSNQLPFDDSNSGKYNYSNIQYSSDFPGNPVGYNQFFSPSSQFSNPSLMPNANSTQVRPSYMRCDMQVRFRPPINCYERSDMSPPTSSHMISHQAVASGNDGTPRHITRMHFDPEPSHIPNYNRAQKSMYSHSTSVNYALAATPRQTSPVPYHQPLHIVTESTGGGITAVSTNFRPNSPQHGYLPNTALPSPQLQIQQPHIYNMHGHNLNRMPSPRPTSPLPTEMPGQSHTSAASPHYNFPPDVTRRPDEGHSFKQALVQRQKSRLEHLRKRLIKENSRLLDLRKEVNDMEKQLIHKQDVGNMFPKEQLLELPILREHNRTLRVKCQCLAWEVDMYSAEENQDFFSQLNTGPSLIQQSLSSRENRKGRSTRHKGQQELTEEQHLQQEITDSESKETEEQWNCVKCTFLNDHLMNRCEVCEMIRIPDSSRDVA